MYHRLVDFDDLQVKKKEIITFISMAIFSRCNRFYRISWLYFLAKVVEKYNPLIQHSVGGLFISALSPDSSMGFLEG